MNELPAPVQPLAVGLLAYVALILALRVSGKRTLAKWNAFDFVVTIALGSVLATTLTSSQVSLAQGVTAMVALIALQFAVAWLAVRSAWVRRWSKSRPRLLLSAGRFDEVAMRAERVTRGEILAAVRAAGIGELERVGAVVLETDGSVSVIERAGSMSALADVDSASAPTHGRAAGS